jgi:hypothetical protein
MPRSISRVALLCGLLALAATTGGCQRGPTWDLAVVEGTVTKEGRPLRGLQVIFLPNLDAGTVGPRSIGSTDEAGHYRLRTDHGDDGVATGKHRVVILDLRTVKKLFLPHLPATQGKEANELSPETARRLEEPRKTATDVSRVPPSYGSFNDTPLRVEVHPGPQSFDFAIP